jgi:hypothetical protein
MEDMDRLAAGGGVPVAAVEADSHGKAIEAGPVQAETHAAKQHGGETHLLSALPIGACDGFVRALR